jgi:2-C-methyl-D-erythritol 2,4-cyclodiphosphate synthase
VTPPLPYRIGHGYDLHRLQPGGVLMLAGVRVSEEISPIAHSDGDVVLHAVVDALLGAIAAGDIGDLFPNTDPHWKNAASEQFVKVALSKVKEAGYQVANCDIMVLAERPKLKPFKPLMKAELAKLLDVPQNQVNIKAGTNEGADSIGRGEAIAAHAILLLLAAKKP